ncbi:MAG: hypothetical protein ACXADY_24910 [Candidatus Hodarchaeales archaeon]|jgi:hypothetical protein
MEPSRKKLETIANQLNLTPNDLEMISQTKKKKKIQYGIVTIFELILGILSFITGFNMAPTSEVIGYPFLTPFIIISNMSINPQIKKKKSIFLLGFISIIILLFGMFSGYTIGMAMKTAYNQQVNGQAIKYNVYFNKIASSHL